jgi:hypothetical protein
MESCIPDAMFSQIPSHQKDLKNALAAGIQRSTLVSAIPAAIKPSAPAFPKK